MAQTATRSARTRSAKGIALSFEAALDRAMENLQAAFQPAAGSCAWGFDATVQRVYVRAVRGDLVNTRDEYEVSVRGRLVRAGAVKTAKDSNT